MSPTNHQQHSEEISNSIDWLFGPFWPLIDLCPLITLGRNNDQAHDNTLLTFLPVLGVHYDGSRWVKGFFLSFSWTYTVIGLMPEMLQKFSVFPDLMEPSSIFVLGGQNPSKQQITKGDLVTVENHYFWIFLGRLLEVHFIWPTGDSIYIQYLTLCWHRWHRSRQCRHGHLWQQAGQLWRWNERCSLVPEAQGFAGVEEGPGYGGLTGSLQLRVVWPIIIHHPLQSLWLRKDIGHIKHAETVSGAARVWKHWCRQQQWHTETTTYNPYSVVHSTTQQVKRLQSRTKTQHLWQLFLLKIPATIRHNSC